MDRLNGIEILYFLLRIVANIAIFTFFFWTLTLLSKIFKWLYKKSAKRRKPKIENKKNHLEKCELNEPNNIEEGYSHFSHPTEKRDLEQNTKLWWNLEGWKMDDGWRLGPDAIIPGKEKIHKLKDDEWIGK